MDADYFLGVADQTMWVLALAAAPVLIPALLAGLILGMIQAATSINAQTLTFVPKLVVVAIALVIFGIFMVTVLGEPLHWRHAAAFLCIMAGVGFLFVGRT